MDEEKSHRELLHELGNALQEKVALQYLLGLAAEHIERLDDDLHGEGFQVHPVEIH